MSSSLSSTCFFRPQTRQATRPMTARTIAPPTPTTTPIMVLRVCLDMPDDELPDDEADRVAVGVVVVAVVTAMVDPSEAVIVVT